MSLLSKSWRHMWCSVPTLYFCKKFSCIGLNFDQTKFQRFVVKCLDRYNNSDSAVTKFKLDIKYYRFINSWLGFTIWLSKVEELDICIIIIFPNEFFYLPPNTFSLRSCTIVKSYGVTLNHLHCTNLPSLKSLSLENVQLDDQVLHNLLIGCCSLEKLVLKKCVSLLKPRISNSSLKFLENFYHSYKTIFEVETTSLKSFAYDGGPSYCKIRLSCSCQKLQHLSLSNTSLYENPLEDIIFRLPLIESLSLCNHKIPHIKFSSDKPKHLVLKEIKNSNVLQTRIQTVGNKGEKPITR